MKKLKDCDEPLDTFLSRARRLGDTLGPILYQLPPRWAFDRERLLGFIAILPRDLTHVFEFREPSWMEKEVLDLLDENGASYCAHDMIGMKAPQASTGPAAYVRFHGGTGKYRGRYSDETLLGWSEWLAGQARSGRDVWAYFNNDIGGAAIEDALTLRSMVAQAMR
jgi:uncharacterized protein YecE (DUF72 family)